MEDILDGVPVRVIDLVHHKRNKQASGRHQDLADLEHLPYGAGAKVLLGNRAIRIRFPHFAFP